MDKKKTTKERGIYKELIHKALYSSTDIRELIIGEDISGMKPSEMQKRFKEHCKSHLFVDDTIQDAGTYIYYDVTVTNHANTKSCQIYMYLICHRDIIDDYVMDGYYGNRADVLSQMIEDVLINDRNVVTQFGIGDLDLIEIRPYNSVRFYGCTIEFKVHNFR